MAYGWGPDGSTKHRWLGGSGTGGIVYSYGWPSGGSLEPNVEAQWLYDEASGSITDEVNSIVLADEGGGKTYNQTVSGQWGPLSPGIDNAGGAFAKTTASTQLDLASGEDFVIEWVASRDSAWSSGFRYCYTLNGRGANNLYGIISYFTLGTPGSIQLDMRSEDDTRVNSSYSVTTPTVDEIKKYRQTGDRSGNAELFVDGASQGTIDISTLELKTFTNTGCRFPGAFSGGNGWYGKIYEWRVTIGNATNKSKSGGDA